MNIKYRSLILTPISILACFGILNLIGVKQNVLISQIIAFCLGILCMLIASRTKVRSIIVNNIKIIYLLLIAILIITLLYAPEIRGSRRWFDIFLFRFQPSEFIKPFFLIALSQYFISNMHTKFIFIFLKLSLYFFTPLLFILKQPDLGTSFLLGITSFLLLFIYGIPKKWLGFFIISLILIIPVSWKYILHDYQRDRIISFINISYDPQGISYNATQSIITVGSGKLFGRGLGFATQSKNLFLPEYHTDFAFASLVEQFGFIGGTTVILLYIWIITVLLFNARRLKTNMYMYFLNIGIASYFFVSMFINIGMNIGVFPITGVTLPLISYGGSSIVATFLMIGFIL